MLGMLINTSMPWAPSPWKSWVDHIEDKKSTFGFQKAALFHDNGAVASATRGFSLTPREVKRLKDFFDINNNNNHESIRLQGKTYIIKTLSEDQMVAFNGKRYFIVCKSKSMYIVVLCESREKCADGAKWLHKLCTKLKEKNF